MKKTQLVLFLFFILIRFVSYGQRTLVYSQPFCKPHSFTKGKFCLNPGELPKFPGGDSSMQAYVAKNLILDGKLHKKASGQTITVIFDVDTSGQLWNIRFNDTKEDHDKIEEAAINLICNMPDWIPAVLRYSDDTASYSAIVEMVADIHFWTIENGNEKPANISLLEWPRSNLHKPVPSQSDVFTFAEKMPSFPGDFHDYLKTNLKYPEREKSEGKEGVVFVSFIIEKDGSISDARVEKEVPNAPGFSEEALRLISSMPKWTPAEMNGKPVRIRCTQPIRFKL